MLGGEPADAGEETKCDEDVTQMANKERAHSHPEAIVTEEQLDGPVTAARSARADRGFAVDAERLRLSRFNWFWSDYFLDSRIREHRSEGGIGLHGV